MPPRRESPEAYCGTMNLRLGRARNDHQHASLSPGPASRAITRWVAGLLMLGVCVTACRTTPQVPYASGPSPVPALARPAHADMARLHVLMINGGGSPAQNYQSHLLHVRQLLALLLQAGT